MALGLAIKKLQGARQVKESVVLMPVAAVSVGIVKGEVFTDLDYEEDSSAEVDMNIVATGEGRLVEVQGTAENKAFSRKQLDLMMDAGMDAVAKLIEMQKKALLG